MRGNISVTAMVGLFIVALAIVVLFVSLGRAGEPIVDFFRNIVDFGNGDDEIKYDPTQEFTVYDEFGSLYPAIRITYTKGGDDEFLFRWDRYLKRTEIAIELNAPSIKKSSGWLTSPFIMPLFKGNDLYTDERNLILYVMGAKSEDEMIKRISDISANENIRIDFPIVRPDYYLVESDDERIVYYLELVSRFPKLEDASGARGKREKIEASEIKQILLELPEYYIFHNKDTDSVNQLNRTIAFMDIFKYYIWTNYKADTCPSYRDITFFALSERKLGTPFVGQWVINFKYDWNQQAFMQIDRNENVIYVRRKDSFFIKFLCDANSEFGVSGIDNYENIKKYPNLQRKLRNGEPYP